MCKMPSIIVFFSYFFNGPLFARAPDLKQILSTEVAKRPRCEIFFKFHLFLLKKNIIFCY